MEEHNIDKFFQQKLNNHGTPPPDDVWDGIAGELDNDKKAAGFYYSKIGLVLLLLLFLFGSGYLIYKVNTLDNRVKLLTNELNEKNSTSDKKETILTSNDSLNKTNDKKNTTTSISDTKSENNISENSKSDRNTLLADEKKIQDNSSSVNSDPAGEENIDRENLSTENTIKTASIVIEPTPKSQRDSNFISSGKRVKPTSNQEGLSDRNEKNTNEPIRTAAIETNPSIERTYTAQNETIGTQRLRPIDASKISTSLPIATPHFSIRDTDYYSLPTHKFLLGAYGITSYNYRRVSSEKSGNSDLISFLDKSEKTAVNYGGGLSLSYDLDKNWRVGLALEYRKRVQEASYPILLNVNEVNFNVNSLNGEMEWTYIENIQSSLGLADFELNETGSPYAGIETASPPVHYETKVSAIQSQNILRIPVLIEYGIVRGNMRYLAGGGLAYDRVISDRSQFSLPEFENATFSEPTSTVGNYFSYHLGVAAEYSITESISIRLSPRYESWLTPVFKNEELRTLPYSFSVAAGVSIRL